MDYFHLAQAQDVLVGGYKCPCCTPIGKHTRRRDKTALHKRARARMNKAVAESVREVKEELGL